MSLRLLAGPFHLKDETGLLPTAVRLVAYWPYVGLFAQGTWVLGSWLNDEGTYKVTLDGVCCRMANRFPLDGPNNKPSWWPKHKRMVTFYYTNPAEYMWEPKTLLQELADAPGAGLEAQPIHMNVTPYLRLLDRWVYLYGNQVRSVRIGQTTPVEEGPVWPFFVFGIAPGRTDEEFFARSNEFGANDYTRCFFYNADTFQFTSLTMYIPGIPETVLYSPEWGVIITSHQDEDIGGVVSPAIRIWSLEVDPQILTNPEVFLGTVKSGQIVTYRVRLTGIHDDPAPDELIDWSITGVGVLLDLQSKTDAQGYATTKVEYRVGEEGESIIGASVQC